MTLFDIRKLPLYWEMSNSEKNSLLTLLKEIKPSISIEIGTKGGGSLQLLSVLSKTVYSIDIDPEVEKLSSMFQNVNFITGDSKMALPELLTELGSKGLQPDFILIDGDHSAEGVKADIENVLKIKVVKPMVVLMHDSFNPDCRKGMSTADYAINSNIDFIDLDFVEGTFSPSKLTNGEMWGGFGIIYLNPESKRGISHFSNENTFSYNRLYKFSKHFYLKQGDLKNRLKYYILRKFYNS